MTEVRKCGNIGSTEVVESDRSVEMLERAVGAEMWKVLNGINA